MGCCEYKNKQIIIKSMKSFKQLSKPNLKKSSEDLENKIFSFSDYSEFIESSSNSSSDKQSEIPINGWISNTNELMFS